MSAPSPPHTDLSLSDLTSLLLVANAAALADTLFYGIHFVLFCICLFLLVRDRRSTHWIILGSAFIMFALSTADVSITIRMMTHDLAYTPDYMMNRLNPKSPIFVTNNFIAELLLLYRCYMIWGRSKYLLVATSFLVLADTIWGYLSLTQTHFALQSKFFLVYVWSVFAINIVITLITAGRIFWISQMILGHQLRKRYHFVIAILIESSAVYSVCILIFLLFPSNSPYRLVATLIVTRVVAIMPTLLTVQVGLDRIVREPDTNDCERHATPIILDTIVTSNHETRDHPPSPHSNNV